MTMQEALLTAKSLIERGWTQGKYARRADGVVTLSGADDAVAWCAIGATRAAVRGDAELMASCLGRLRAFVPVDHSIADWNDTPGRTREDVIALFELAAS